MKRKVCDEVLDYYNKIKKRYKKDHIANMKIT